MVLVQSRYGGSGDDHGSWFEVDIMGLGVMLVPISPPDPLYRLGTRAHGRDILGYPRIPGISQVAWICWELFLKSF